MAIVPVRLPQMGEGLQEALLVEFLKQPGDRIERDEPLYVMETDKASTEVESPVSGRVVEWLVKAGSVLPIGTLWPMCKSIRKLRLRRRGLLIMGLVKHHQRLRWLQGMLLR